MHYIKYGVQIASFGVLAATVVYCGSVSAQYRQRAPVAAQEECPQGRQIRAQKAYPSTMSDCEVLDADTAAENQKQQRGPAPGPYPVKPPSQKTQWPPTAPPGQERLQADPLRQWCTEHTNPATCSPIQSCIEFCVQKSVQHDPAAMAAQLQAEHEAKRKQQEQQAAIAGKFELAKQQGYRPASFEDFKLDGKKLAEANAKLILQGFYSKSGDVEILQPSGLAVATARQYGNDNGIPLLTEDAARDVRKYFLQCGNNPLAQLGCPVTASGHADLCTVTSLLGSKSVPCLVVEDGW